MEDIFKIILYSYFAGVTVFLGGLVSKYFETYFRDGFVKEEVVHTSIAFGGGIIIAAVAFVLVPQKACRVLNTSAGYEGRYLT